MTPGLANKISQRFATKIFTSFAETKKFFPERKTKVIGSPIRKEILMGSAEKGQSIPELQQTTPNLNNNGGKPRSKKNQ